MATDNTCFKPGWLFAGLALLLTGCRTHPTAPPTAEVWRGLHMHVASDTDLSRLEEQFPKLTAVGVNVLILQMDYAFDFQSHPELRDRTFITKAKAREFAAAAKKLGIRVIPELDCLGHQSGGPRTYPLLVKYPQFDETPGEYYPTNHGIYCRSWCPLNPGVNKVVFPLIDELVDAFQADAFHVGMDEVFIIGDKDCPRCRGKNTAELFAKQVNDLHHHIVDQRHWTMLMWGDRLLDAKAMHYGRWESATNGTARAVTLIPKDIIICDWHYLKQTNYPSVPFFLEQGFRVWPSGFQPLEASEAFSQFSLAQRQENPRLIGYLATTWSKAKPYNVGDWPPVIQVLPEWKGLKAVNESANQ